MVTNQNFMNSIRRITKFSNSDAAGELNRNTPPKKSEVEKKTFKRFFEIELWRDNPNSQALFPILCALEKASRDINMLMRRVSTDNLEGLNSNRGNSLETVNIQGENQRKLDVIANRIMKTSLCATGELKAVASEEEDELCLCSTIIDNSAFSGDYVAVFDPLDGSANIDSGLPTGTIFGIYKKLNSKSSIDDSMTQRGNQLIIAGYCLFSSSTHLVITIRNGLHMFTLDDVSGEFYLTKSNVKIPRSGDIYSFNDAYYDSWNNQLKQFISDFRNNKLNNNQNNEENLQTKKPSARYMGALVADVHNIICNGGIFGYPGTADKPNGKLRLVYEANPLALIIEEAGGYASDGNSRILNKNVEDVHQRTELYIGSYEDVKTLETYLAKE